MVTHGRCSSSLDTCACIITERNQGCLKGVARKLCTPCICWFLAHLRVCFRGDDG